jgi:TonB-dependent receptor
MVNARSLLALAVAVAAAGVRAQDKGTLRGSVRDREYDAPLTGALVQIAETQQRAVTDDRGNYLLPNVAPGRYTLIAIREGYVRAVHGDVVVTAGQISESNFDLAGDYTDLEEFVACDPMRSNTASEQALLELRLASPALVDSIGADLIGRANASDAAQALRLVSGASTADGKSAVIRGLPDRYVSSQMNGVLLPSADEDKRAVELDQFPAAVIESLQVAKTFTPDQQGNASGGAVNLVLRGVPEQPAFFSWKLGRNYNSQVGHRSDFLTYRGGGVRPFGKSGSDRPVQEVGTNWDGAVGTERAQAPIDQEFTFGGGGHFDIGGGWRAGGFVEAYQKHDSSYTTGKDDSLWALNLGDPLTPQFSQGSPQSGEFYTSLLDVTQAKQSSKWGGLATAGVADDSNSISLTYLYAATAEDTATLAEDTRGKQYFFPGHDPKVPTSPGFEQPLAAPYLRLQTLAYEERLTETLQLNGRHRLDVDVTGSARPTEFDWTIAKSRAVRDQPDKRQFATAWNPNGVYLQYKPAAQFTLGNLQRIFEKITEDSDEASANLEVPFDFGDDRHGYLKIGGFYDHVDRTFNQDTFSNFSDPTFFFPGQFDEIDWTQVWGFQNHPITASNTDVDYKGEQQITAAYAMLELPLTDWMKVVGGARLETTSIRIVNQPEANALWVPPGQFGIAALQPGDGDVDFHQQDVLPALALVIDPVEHLTLRLSYAETVARQTFKELTPIFQQEYLGGPVFVGNPDLRMSSVRNYDVRIDWRPVPGGLLSSSWFKKDIEDPIEYVEKIAAYSFTTAVNYPHGTLTGIEVEARQEMGDVWSSLRGLSLGANSTWIDASVHLPDDEIQQFTALHGTAPSATRDMTNAPDYLWNLFGTWDVPFVKTRLGLFYTVTGDTLVKGPGPSNSFFVPATYDTRWDSLSATIMQPLGQGVAISLAVKNLTNPTRREVYRSEFIGDDVTRRTWSEGIDWTLSIGGEITF